MLGLVLFLSALVYFISVLVLLVLRVRWGLRLVGAVSLVLIAGLVILFIYEAGPVLGRDGFGVFLKADWDPVRESYGVLPAVVGTLITSAIAVAMAFPLAVGITVAINEVFPRGFRNVFASLLDLTAAMPTVIYGLWGLFVLGPLLKDVVNGVSHLLVGGVVMPSSNSLFTASVLLAVMITPYMAAVMREGYATVPKPVEEAIYAVGATKFEAVLVKLRYIKQYIFGGLFLALGRAMGETVAVAMVVGGNFSRLTLNVFDSGITISSLIALQFPNAAAYQYMIPALFAAAFVLAFMGLAINGVAVYLLTRGQT